VGYDLALASLTIESNNPAPGEDIDIIATVENRGDLPVQNVRVLFYDGAPENGGMLIADTQIDVELLVAGGKADAYFAWSVPLVEQSHQIYATVEAGAAINDRDPSNNGMLKLTTLPDLLAETCWSTQVSSTMVSLSVRVANKGVVPSGKFSISWRAGSTDGGEIGRSTVEALAAGGVYEGACLWERDEAQAMSQVTQVFAVVDFSNEIVEFDETNNSHSLSVFGPEWNKESETSPIAHWAFDETSGNVASDSVGDNHGTVHGATWTDGILDGALQFDGVDDYIDCGTDPNLAPDLFTLSLWTYPQASSGSRSILRKAGWDTDKDYDFKLFAARNPTFSFGNGSKTAVLHSSSKLPLDEWTHIALTRNETEAAIYINGTELLSKVYDFGPSATDFRLIIGGGSLQPYEGKIDDVRIYDSVLSDEDIESLASEVE